MNAALKEQLRTEMRARRKAVREADRREASRAVISHFLGNVPLEKTDIIGGYWAAGSELNMRYLLECLEEEGYQLALPRIVAHEKPLEFKRYKRGNTLHQSLTFRIEEPSKLAETVIPNVLITPLLAFDKRGYRLGQGGGYYDRTILQLHTLEEVTKRVFTVGVGYSFQEVERIPTDIYDQRLDCIITEDGVVVPPS